MEIYLISLIKDTAFNIGNFNISVTSLWGRNKTVTLFWIDRTLIGIQLRKSLKSRNTTLLQTYQTCSETACGGSNLSWQVGPHPTTCSLSTWKNEGENQMGKNSNTQSLRWRKYNRYREKNTNEWCKDNHSPAPRSRVVGLMPSQSTATTEQQLPSFMLSRTLKGMEHLLDPLGSAGSPATSCPLPAYLQKQHSDTVEKPWHGKHATTVQLKPLFCWGRGRGRSRTRCGMREHFLKVYCRMDNALKIPQLSKDYSESDSFNPPFWKNSFWSSGFQL